jgi:hypothetical protein
MVFFNLFNKKIGGIGSFMQAVILTAFYKLRTNEDKIHNLNERT